MRFDCEVLKFDVQSKDHVSVAGYRYRARITASRDTGGQNSTFSRVQALETMDTLSHALWAGAVGVVAQRVKLIDNRTIGAIVAFAALPDVIHLAPIVIWVLFGDGTIAVLYLYAIALPGREPAMPAIVEQLAHHFHCILHSAVVASGVTLITLLAWCALWIPLLGWWSHIVLDVFTHSAEYYPSPVLYPFSDRGFDGLACNRPIYLILNYVLLAGIYLWLFRTRARRDVE
jgi:membrane-bound metal-dependent hydrolase YbcI (DUF457 family)